MSHARDFDDTHDAAVLHAGVTAVPAAIAAGQLRGTSPGADLIAAVAAGLEVTCRLGVATRLGLIESGFIYTSLLGYFGATAAAGRALGLTANEMVNAFGIVYSSGAGNHQVTRDASLMKRLQPGLAAQAAVVAVQLARRGLRGAQGVFDGADGFFRVYLRGHVDGDAVRKDLGRRFELMNLSYKPYPCCRDVHTAVDAALQLRAAAQRPECDIQSIRVGVTAPGYQMVCVPEHVRSAPRTIVEAQFSLPYTVAASWIDGGLDFGHFSDEGLRRADILDLASRVQPYVDAELDRDWSRVVTPAKVHGYNVEEIFARRFLLVNLAYRFPIWPNQDRSTCDSWPTTPGSTTSGAIVCSAAVSPASGSTCRSLPRSASRWPGGMATVIDAPCHRDFARP